MVWSSTSSTVDDDDDDDDDDEWFSQRGRLAAAEFATKSQSEVT